jgi:hypothetical protein
MAAALAGAAARGQQPAAPDLLDRAQQAVVKYISTLADVHCTEDVEQVKMRSNGRAAESLKAQYDYFILLQGTSTDFQLAESRLAKTRQEHRPEPLLLSNGFSMLLLIFHPYWRPGFNFSFEGWQDAEGHHAARYHFAHVSGARSPAALALRGREYPLDLQGTAWVDAESGQPLRIDAELLQPMMDIGLKSLGVHVEYAAATNVPGKPVLASVADVDLETPRQHWKNTHVFRNYQLFATDATQDPNVKVHQNAKDAADEPTQPSTQENP